MDEKMKILIEIQEEIDYLEKYRWNLKKTIISSDNRLNHMKRQSYKILDEVERVSIEINHLEKQKSNFLIN
jgi:archaellum component FlaC